MSSSVTTSGVPRGWGVDVAPRGDAPDGEFGPGEVDTDPSVLGSQVRGEVGTSPIRRLQNNPSLAGGLVGMCPTATFPEFAHSIEVIAVDNDRADACLTFSMIEMTRRSAKRVMVSERTGRAASKYK